MQTDFIDQQLALERECQTFARYLTHDVPGSYVVRKYVECHPVVLRHAPPSLPVDDAMLRFAAAGPYRTRIADAYARIFRPKSILRRKLILLFAILENSKGYHQQFTRGGDDVRWLAWWRISLSVTTFLAALCAGIVMFAPRELFARSAARNRCT
jgi:hypothetical protein